MDRLEVAIGHAAQATAPSTTSAPRPTGTSPRQRRSTDDILWPIG